MIQWAGLSLLFIYRCQVVDFRKHLEKEICAKAKQFAELPENIILVDRMREIAAGTSCPVGDIPAYVFRVRDYRIVYSLEEHPQHDGSIRLLKHMSVSMPKLTEKEEYAFLEMICEYMGFDDDDGMKCYLEDLGDRAALNMVQKYKG